MHCVLHQLITICDSVHVVEVESIDSLLPNIEIKLMASALSANHAIHVVSF
jgi:hypothetical protein